MPKDHSYPINEADRQARAAFRAYADWYHDSDPLGSIPIQMNDRTIARIWNGERDVPPGAARELAARIREDMVHVRNRDQLEGWAMALEIWAEDCDQRSEARHA